MPVYTPLISSPAVRAADAIWFAFRGNELVVRPGASPSLPQARALEDLGLEALRVQYLGKLDDTDCYSAELPETASLPDGLATMGLRAVLAQFDQTVGTLAGRAIQIIDWDRSHLFCGRCGTPTVARTEERARVCPSCSHSSFPRLAPAIMVLICRGHQLLLARSPRFRPGMFSALAGFVEPGETLEQTAVREVREEVGLEITNLRYFSSQPWPFPHSLMIAFTADYAGGELNPDGVEIEDAGWFDIDRLPPLPDSISIARKLIDATVAEMRANR